MKLGLSLRVASCVILAIRTAKWAARSGGTHSQRDLDTEVDHAIFVADRMLSNPAQSKESLFPQKDAVVRSNG